MSARYCGCDAEVGWTCEQHRLCDDEHGGYRCDLRRGHEGWHSGHHEQSDEVASWPAMAHATLAEWSNTWR